MEIKKFKAKGLEYYARLILIVSCIVGILVINSYMFATSKVYEFDNVIAYESSNEITVEESEKIVEETKKEVEPVAEKPVQNVVTATVPESVHVDSSIEPIIANYNLTSEEFYTLVAIVAAEGGGSYTDAYAVINVIYNRTQSPRWSNYASNMGRDGSNLYVQATLPNQFTVYQSGSYLRHMYVTDNNAYKAVVTFLTTGEKMHNFLSFRSASTGVAGTQFIEGGNIYFAES